MSRAIDTAALDFMLEEQGDRIQFANATSTFGLFRASETLVADGNAFEVAGTRTTLLVREGTQPKNLAEDQTLHLVREDPRDHRIVREAFLVRDCGKPGPDGLRRITLQAV